MSAKFRKKVLYVWGLIVCFVAGLWANGEIPAAAKPAPQPLKAAVWRQGGDPSNWAEEGTTNYAVTVYTEQMGTAITDGNGQVFVTFPVIFSDSPILTYSVLGHVDVKMVAVGATGAHFVANHDDGEPASGVTIYWQATGP